MNARIPAFPAALRRCLLAVFIPFAVSHLHASDPFAENIRTTDPLAPEQEQRTFHLPPGFEIQLVAAEPDIGKPMNMAFDASGRLWLTQSREYPFAAPLDKPARDRIQVLSDFDEHGRARKITTFADGLNIPIGLYPYRDGVIAFSIPNIYFFRDTDGDGRADKKELILGRFGFEKDVHGLTSAFRRGYDGWIYADHGYNNDSVLTARDGSTIRMNSGNCYRFRFDGSRVEQFSWGQVNPFGLMFDPLGDLWSADCHSSPVYQLLRGAYYPSFGKPNDGLGFGPDICRHSHGSTAIAGMVLYAADNFPADFRGNTFVGNVMTCRIDRDSLVEHGSTRLAKEEPDFMSTDDPWFRPVDLQLGPDGALYVADFYNRIIGHYEVPLTHPGRDRERGRIWRITYHGANATPHPRLRDFDLSKAPIAQLISELANANITRRMLAMNQLSDRIGAAAAGPLKELLREKNATAFQKIHGLWVLYRLGALDDAQLGAAAKDADRGVRVHAMRILSETASWSAQQDRLALAGLHDADPYVERAAADALGQHPGLAHIQPLLAVRERVAPEDAQRLHVVRMALRNQFQPEGTLARLRNLSEKDSRAIADVALGLKSAESGSFLLRHIEKYPEPRTALTEYLRHISRYAPQAEMGKLASLTRARCADDLDLQMTLFKSIEEGVGQRGGAIDPAVRDWGAELTGRLLSEADAGGEGWRNFPIKGNDSPNPWFLQERKSADGHNGLFLCSLPPEGEKLTGILRSKTFTIPETLTFYIAGHDGLPSHKPAGKNFIRLVDRTTGQTLAQSPPPRNDTAQQVTWDLKQQAGKSGFLEIVDGNTGASYAWLAAGRFSPDIAPLPAVSPSQLDARQRDAAEIAGRLKLSALEPHLARLLRENSAPVDVRAAAAKALGVVNPEKGWPGLVAVVSNAEEPGALRAKVATVLGELNFRDTRAALVAALATVPYDLQRLLGLALASTTEGGEALLQAVADGKASAQLLQERNIHDRLVTSKPENVVERIKQLTANLAPPDAARQKLLEARRTAFNPATASANKGAAVFKQNCAICHSIDGQGATIAPQLDGVGGRGLARLVEDILDPNRNVDRAFRTTLLILNDGDVQSGLFRREEGEMLVLAESTGKEISVPKKEVKERRESETSLMPDNLSDIITPVDFNDLLAFLLAHSVKPPGPR